jgi:hypothetical protein
MYRWGLSRIHHAQKISVGTQFLTNAADASVDNTADASVTSAGASVTNAAVTAINPNPATAVQTISSTMQLLDWSYGWDSSLRNNWREVRLQHHSRFIC